MFKNGFAAVVAAGIVLSISNAASAAPPWPTSINESAPSQAAGPQLPLTPLRQSAAAGSATLPSGLPLSVSDATPSERLGESRARAGFARDVGATGSAGSPSSMWRGATPAFPRTVSDGNPSE